MMKQSVAKISCVVMAGIVFPLFAGVFDNAWIKGTTDKNPLSYKTGEEMVFTLELQGVDGDISGGEYTLWWKRSDDFGATEADTKALRWEVRSNGNTYAFDPEQNKDPEVAYFNGMVIPGNKAITWVQGSEHGYVPPDYEGRDFVVEK